MSIDPIGSYVRDLRCSLRVGAARRWRISREVRLHLESSVEDALARGETRERAEREAIARFGSAEETATGFNRLRLRRRVYLRRAAIVAVTASATIAGGSATVWALVSPSTTPAAAHPMTAPPKRHLEGHTASSHHASHARSHTR